MSDETMRDAAMATTVSDRDLLPEVVLVVAPFHHISVIVLLIKVVAVVAARGTMTTKRQSWLSHLSLV
jgi:hypothetical protein